MVKYGVNNNNTNNEDKKKDYSTNHLYTISNNNAWVRNTWSTLLTEAQVKLISHGPNYAVVPSSPPIVEYVAFIEQVCTALKQGETGELGGEVKTIIKKIQPPKYSLTREEHKALEVLKKDKNRMVLTADKGVSIVVIDKEEYNRKAEELLRQPTYKPIPTDPTNKYKQVNIPVEEHENRVWWIYRRILQNIWREVQGTSKGLIPHIWPLQHHWLQNHPR